MHLMHEEAFEGVGSNAISELHTLSWVCFRHVGFVQPMGKGDDALMAIMEWAQGQWSHGTCFLNGVF